MRQLELSESVKTLELSSFKVEVLGEHTVLYKCYATRCQQFFRMVTIEHKYHSKLLTVISYRSQIAIDVFIVDCSQSSDPLLTWAKITVNCQKKYYN